MKLLVVRWSVNSAPWVLLVLLLAPAVRASEESEILVARGEVAMAEGHPQQAQALFAEAVAADGDDAAARHALGLSLAALGRWDEAAAAFEQALALDPDLEAARVALADARAHHGTVAGAGTPRPRPADPGEAVGERGRAAGPGRRPWSLHASSGVQYDSNVTLAPRGQVLPHVGQHADAAFLFALGGEYDLVDQPDALVRVSYDFYQSLHPSIHNFNLRSQSVRATAGHRLGSSLWAGVQGGYERYSLGSHGYLGDAFVTPFLSLLEESWGLTQLTYRHGEETYFSRPFNGLRDGPVDVVGMSQVLYQDPRYLAFGYDFGIDDPRPATGSDYDLRAHEAYVGVGFPLWWQATVDLMYLLRYEDYTRPNSFAGFRKTRQDAGHHVYVNVERPITQNVSVALAYFGTANLSNVDVFDYRRQVVSALVEWTY